MRRCDEIADPRRTPPARLLTQNSRLTGVGPAIAASSLATEWVKGKTIEQAMAIRNTEIASELALPPVKMHCSVLAEEAIKAAVADLKKKQAASRSRAHTKTQTRTYPPENKRVSVASQTGLMYILRSMAAEARSADLTDGYRSDSLPSRWANKVAFYSSRSAMVGKTAKRSSSSRTTSKLSDYRASSRASRRIHGASSWCFRRSPAPSP